MVSKEPPGYGLKRLVISSYLVVTSEISNRLDIWMGWRLPAKS